MENETTNEAKQSVLSIVTQNDGDLLLKLQKFQQLLNREPTPESLDKTPDGKAKTVTISHIEMTLDEIYFGLWSTENFKWSAIANEVQGSLELVLVHPITGREVRRAGTASVIIMVDKAPENIQGQERNRWALNPDNKKPNALDMAFPKLKAECLKNAAQSLGKIFGRDINRQAKNVDTYKPLIKGDLLPALPPDVMEKIIEAIEQGKESEVSKVLTLEFDAKQKEEIKTKINRKSNGK